MIYVKINELLTKKKKSKYWFIKHMTGNYQSLSNLMNNKTTGIKFETLDKLCEVFECEPGEIIVRKKYSKRKKAKNEQVTKKI